MSGYHAGKPSELLAAAAVLLQMAVHDCVSAAACTLLSSTLPPLSKLLEASCVHLRHALQRLPYRTAWPADTPPLLSPGNRDSNTNNSAIYHYMLSQINNPSGCSTLQSSPTHAQQTDMYSNQSVLMYMHEEPSSPPEASRSSSGTFSEASVTAAVRRAAAAVRLLDACVSSVRDACMQCMRLRDKDECVEAFDLRVACIAAGVRVLPAALGWQTQHKALCALA